MRIGPSQYPNPIYSRGCLRGALSSDRGEDEQNDEVRRTRSTPLSPRGAGSYFKASLWRPAASQRRASEQGCRAISYTKSPTPSLLHQVSYTKSRRFRADAVHRCQMAAFASRRTNTPGLGDWAGSLRDEKNRVLVGWPCRVCLASRRFREYLSRRSAGSGAGGDQRRRRVQRGGDRRGSIRTTLASACHAALERCPRGRLLTLLPADPMRSTPRAVKPPTRMSRSTAARCSRLADRKVPRWRC